MPDVYVDNNNAIFLLISVIIPAHNEIKNIKELVPKLLGIGLGGEFEILVCVSPSNSDASLGLTYSKEVKLLSCPNSGRASQMNFGAAAAEGEILTFLHADVRPPNTFFSDIKTSIENGFKAGFFSYRFDKDNFFLRLNASYTSKDGIFTGGGDQCLFIQKTTFETLGCFDDRQVLMEDFEFFKRMKKAKVPYKIIKNDLTVSARKYENNSYARVNLSNLLLVFLFKMGYAPDKLKTLHNRLLKLPYQKNS